MNKDIPFCPDTAPLVLGVTGASGALIARKLLDLLLTLPSLPLHLVFTPLGEKVWHYELGAPLPTPSERLTLHPPDVLFAPLASGSFPTRGMVIAPCSMGTLAKITSGVTDNLLTRAADVTLKERRPLVLVPRESPLSQIHLRNLLTLAEMGVIVAPPMLTLYHHPMSIETMVEDFAAHLCQLLGLSVQRQAWGGEGKLAATPRLGD